MALNPRWTAHIKDKEKRDKFAETVLNSKIIADRLRVIVESEIDSVARNEANETYDTPGWDYKQAHRNGYYRALRLLKDLLDFTDREEKPKGPLNAIT